MGENSKGILETLSQLSYLSFERIRQGIASVSVVKNLPAIQETEETWVQTVGWEDPLEEEMATHSSVLVWEIP